MHYFTGVGTLTVKGISDIGVVVVLHCIHFSMFLFAAAVLAAGVFWPCFLRETAPK